MYERNRGVALLVVSCYSTRGADNRLNRKKNGRRVENESKTIRLSAERGMQSSPELIGARVLAQWFILPEVGNLGHRWPTLAESYARAVLPCHTSHRRVTYEEIGASPCSSIAGNAGENNDHRWSSRLSRRRRRRRRRSSLDDEW